jgi:hypothetical protein
MNFKALQWRGRFAAVILGLACGVAGCETNPSEPPAAAAAAEQKSELQFLDLQSFDRELAGSLAAPLPKVDVTFYDRVTPSALPERLQNWLTSVEAGGGTVKVTPPKSDISAKDPFLLISLVSSLWSATKMTKAAVLTSQFRSARTYDAEIVLKEDEKGENVVDKLVFVLRPSTKP